MADPIFMLSLVDANEAAELDAAFASAPLPPDAFARLYAPYVDSTASFPLIVAADERPFRIAG